jgi:haloalkane dehalogenase
VPNETKLRYPKQFASVRGSRMAYVDVGEGDPIVFLHGNPMSSHLWRNVIPHVEHCGRCIAPDLIGMGDSDRLPDSGPERYRIPEHAEYLAALLEQLGVERNVTLVIHDWGSALGFDWANRHRDAVKGIAYMEAIVTPVTWADWPESARGIFQGFRSEKGEDLILKRNMFVEAVLPSAVLRKLTDEEMEHYRAPFATADDRQPTLNWPRAIPIEGEPVQMVDLVSEYGEWMAGNDLPKLFINADPGSILVGPQREFCRSWPNQTEVTVAGAHFLQEDSPAEIGQAVARWMQTLRSPRE